MSYPCHALLQLCFYSWDAVQVWKRIHGHAHEVVGRLVLEVSVKARMCTCISTGGATSALGLKLGGLRGAPPLRRPATSRQPAGPSVCTSGCPVLSLERGTEAGARGLSLLFTLCLSHTRALLFLRHVSSSGPQWRVHWYLRSAGAARQRQVAFPRKRWGDACPAPHPQGCLRRRVPLAHWCDEAVSRCPQGGHRGTDLA